MFIIIIREQRMPHYIDPNNIFPKRMGIMNGNTIVIEYYDLERDKFKKHPIPYNPLDEVKLTVDEIFKNSKHFPFLKKIDPKHIRAVLEGNPIISKKPSSNQVPSFQQQFKEFTQNRRNVQQYYRPPPPDEPLEDSYSKNNNSYSNSFSQAKHQPKQQVAKVQEVDDYYAEEFQDFQISQSMDKGSKSINSISNIEKPKSSISQVSSSFSKSKQQPRQKQEPKKEEIKSKIQVKVDQKKAAKEVIQQVIEDEYADDFQILEQEPKKQKKAKKEKKQKSKQKKQKKPKKQKVQKVSVEEQFQFL